jgi:hypothetical protein
MYVSSATVVVPIGIGIYRKAFLSKTDHVIFYLLLVSLFVESVSAVLAVNTINNMWLYHIYTVLEFTLLTYFYSRYMKDSSWSLILICAYVLFLMVAAFESYSLGPKDLDNISTALESILIFVYALATYGRMMKQLEHTNLLSTSLFWINTAIFSYFSVCFFLFIFSNYLLKDSVNIHLEMWGIHSVINIVFYSLISIGFWKTSIK